MAGKKAANKDARKSSAAGFTAEERAAMREHVQELKAAKRRGPDADAEGDVLAKIAAMPAADRKMAERIHAIVKANAPHLVPRLWYGMPAYSKNGNVVCFFQGAHKFKARYGTLGFSDKANLDDGLMWPSSFALARLTAVEEKKIAELVKKAAS